MGSILRQLIRRSWPFPDLLHLKKTIVSKEGLTGGSHSLSIKLWDEPTVEQTLWRTKFEELIQTCVNYVMENKNKLGISVRRSEMEGPKGGASPLKYNVVDDGDEQVRTDSSPFMQERAGFRKGSHGQDSWTSEFLGLGLSRVVGPSHWGNVPPGASHWGDRLGVDSTSRIGTGIQSKTPRKKPFLVSSGFPLEPLP